MPRSARPFVAPRLLSVTAALALDGYAFSKSGDTITAYDYAGSTNSATRGTFDATAYPLWGSQYTYTTSGTTSRSLILTDSDGNVGDGSLIFVGDDDKVVTWDVEGATSYSRTAAAGYHIGGVVFSSGYAYWMEVENSPHGGGRYFYVRLMRGRSDFTSVSTIATREMDGGTTDGVGADAYKIRRTSTGCWAAVRMLMGETEITYDAWFGDGGTTSQQSASANATDGEPRADGDSVFGTVPYSQEASTGTETALYPSASDGGEASRNVTADQSIYQSYSFDYGNSYRWSTLGDAVATTADEIVSFSPAEDIYFYYGS